MRLLTCLLVLLGAFVIPAWNVDPVRLRLDEAKTKAKSQLSVPSPNQRGKRQYFFVPDIDFQDGLIPEEFDPTEYIRLSKKKVLPDNAEHLPPHFHRDQPFYSPDDTTAHFSCLCKKLAQLNENVDNRIDVRDAADPRDLHLGQSGFPRDAHHQRGLPEGFGQPLMIEQQFRETEDPIENQREAHLHGRPHHTVIHHHHQPYHTGIHHHKPHHGFGHPIHQKFRQADSTSNFDEFREADLIEPDFNDNLDQQLRHVDNQEFEPDFSEGFVQQSPVEREDSSRPEHSRDFHNIKGIVDGLKPFIDKPKPEVNFAKNDSKVDEQFERFAEHEDKFREFHQLPQFRQAEEHSNGNFDEFRDVDLIEPELNDNQNQQFRNVDNREFQPVFNGANEGFVLQSPVEREDSSRPEHSRDLQNIKGIVDGLKPFIDKTKPEVNPAKNDSKVDEQFERFAEHEDKSREFHHLPQFRQAEEPSSRPEHSRDLQNIKGIVDGLKPFIDKPKPEVNSAKNDSKVDEQFERFAEHEDKLREFHHLPQFRQAEEPSSRPEHSRDLQNIKGIVDGLKPFIDKPEPEVNPAKNDSKVDEQFERFAEHEDKSREFHHLPQFRQSEELSSRPEHSRDLQNIKGIVDGLKPFIDKPKPEVNPAKNDSKVDEQFERFAEHEDKLREFHHLPQFRQAEEPSSRPEHSRDLQNIKGIVDGLKPFIDKSKPEVNPAKNDSKVDEQFERFAEHEDKSREFHHLPQFRQAEEHSSRPGHSRDLQNIKDIVDGLKPFIDKPKPEVNPAKNDSKVDEQFERFTEHEDNFRGFHHLPQFRQAEEPSSRPEHSRDLQNIKGIVDGLKPFIDKPKPEVNPAKNDSKVDEQFERFAEHEDKSREFQHLPQFRQAEEPSSRPDHSRDLQNIKGIVDGLKPFIDKSKPEVNPAKNDSKVDEQFGRFAEHEDKSREFHHLPQFRQAEEPSSRPEHSRDLQNIKGIVDGLKPFIDKPKPKVNPAKNDSKVDEQFERFAEHEDKSREFHHLPQFRQAEEVPSRPEHSRDLQNIKGLVDTLNKYIEEPKPAVNLGENETKVDEQFERFSEHEDKFGKFHHIPEFRQAEEASARPDDTSIFDEFRDVDPIEPDLDDNQDQKLRQLQDHQEFVPQAQPMDEAQLRDAHLHHHTLIHNHRGLHHQAVVPGFGHGITPGVHQTVHHQSSFQQPGFHHSVFQQPGFHHSGFQQPGFHHTGFQQIGLGGHQSSFQQQTIQPNTLIQTQSINSRTNPQQIAPGEIRNTQDDTSEQVFDPFHEKDATMDFLDRHQFDLPHPGFRNIEEPDADGQVLRRVEGATDGESPDELREARTFDPRDLFGDRVFNLLADFEQQNPQLRNADHDGDDVKFDPTDLFSEDSFPNFMSDLAKQNEGRTDFIETGDDVQRNGNQDLASPHLFNVPRNLDWQRKKRSMLDQILERERQLVESINKTRNEDLNFIGNLGDRLLGDIERRRNLIQKLAAKTKDLKPVDVRSRMDLNQLIMEQRLMQRQVKKKRSIPLMRMISDPKVKLDLPKTMENFGTATKNVFEDEKAPMYHVKHLLGASRNAVLSAMKIPPQNIIIPSDYEIVKKDPEEVSSEEGRSDERDPMGFAKTFKKVGNIVRNSILSSHETANHIGEIAQDVKNVLHTVRHAAPRLILPYSQIPAINRPPHKAMLITPRILDLTQAKGIQAQEDHKLVKLGHIMDAVGISKPGDSKLALDKIVFEPHYKRRSKPPSEKLAQLYSRFQDTTADTVGEAVNALEDAKVSVGAKNLHDFLDKMRNALVHPAVVHHKHHKTRKQQKEEEIDKFVQALFDDSKNDTVGAGLPLAKELWQPFMGRASQAELKEFKAEPRRSSSGHRTLHHTLSHRKHAPSSSTSSTVNNETVGAFIEFLKSRDEAKTKRDDHHNMRHLLGAINPMMFERMYNETLNVKTPPEEAVVVGTVQPTEESKQDGKVGSVMRLPSTIMKPFMGQADPGAVQDFLNTYNGDMGEVEAKDDEDVQIPILVDDGAMM